MAVVQIMIPLTQTAHAFEDSSPELHTLSVDMPLDGMPQAGSSGFIGAITAPGSGATPVYTVGDLRAIENNMSGSYVLMNDIDVSSYNGGDWIPLGDNSNPFMGSLDGQGHQIRNLQCASSEHFDAGLFARAEHGTFLNLGLVLGSAGIAGSNTAGALVGSFENGTIEEGITDLEIRNCYIKGNVGGNIAGGLIGTVFGNVTIDQCYMQGNVTAEEGLYGSLGSVTAGGILGDIYGAARITDSFADGAVLAQSDELGAYSGGLVGYQSGGPSSAELSGCYSLGAVTAGGFGDTAAGGLVGFGVRQNISQCYSAAEVTATAKNVVDSDEKNDSYAGGIIAYSFDGNFSECYSYGQIIAEYGYAMAGGIVGYQSSAGNTEITSCISHSAVEATASANRFAAAGGILGSGTADISGCESHANLTAEAYGTDFHFSWAGGIAGDYMSDSIKNCITSGVITAKSGWISEAAGMVGNTGAVSISGCRSSAQITASVIDSEAGFWAHAAGMVANAIDSASLTNCAFTGSAAASYNGGSQQAYGFSATDAAINGSIYNTSGLPLAPNWSETGDNVTMPDGADIVFGTSEDIDYGSAYGAYYSPSETGTFFRINVIGDTYPQTKGFTVTVNGEDNYTGDNSNEIWLKIPDDYTGSVVFSKEGCYSYEMPMFLVKSTYNFISLERERTGTAPVVRAVFGKSGSNLTNLRLFGMDLYANDGALYEVFADVNWRGQTPDEVWLEQGSVKIPVSGGTTGAVLLGSLLKADGGAVYICAKNTGGETVKAKINLHVMEKTSNMQIDVIKNVDLTSPDNIAFLANTQLKYDIGGLIPVEIEFNQDGTFKAVVGVKLKGPERTKQMFGKLKDAYEAFKNDYVGAGIDDEIERILKEEDALTTDMYGSFSVKSSVKFVGFVEGRVENKNGAPKLTYTDSGIIVSGKGEVKATQQFYLVYAQAALSNTLKLVFSLADLQEDGTLLNISDTTSVKVGGGLGVADIVSVGASGTGSLVISSTIPEFSENLDIYSQYSLALGEVSLLGFGLTIHTYESDKYYWMKDGAWALGESSAGEMSVQGTGFRQLSREYLRSDTKLTASREAMLSLSVDEGNTALTSSVFKTNTYPAAEPQIAKLSDGTRILVWVEDDGLTNRPVDENRTALYYSVYDGGTKTWSDPMIVHQDHTADFSPRLKVINGTAYLLWMNASTEFIGGEDLETIAKSMNISCAQFSATNHSFDSIACVHDLNTESLNMMADITVPSGTQSPTVVWLRNTAGDYSCEEGTTSLWQSEWNGSSWTGTQLDPNVGVVDSLTASDEGDLAVYYSKDTDGNANTAEDKEIFKYSNDNTVQYTENDMADTKPRYVNGTLTYYSGGEIKTGTESAVLSLDTDRYQYLAGDSGIDAIVYCEAADQFTTQIYALFNDGTGWGSPIPVAKTDGYLTGCSTVMLSGGTLNIATDVMELDGGTAKLVLYELKPFCDLKVTGSDYDSYSLTDGGNLAVSVKVSNLGTSAVNYLHVTVTDNDTEVASKVFLESLLPGGEAVYDLVCPLPEGYTGNQLTVKAVPLGITDQDETDNVTTLQMKRDDVSVEELSAATAGDKTVVSVVVVNRGLNAVSDVPIRLKTGSLDSADAASQSVSLESQKACSVTFEIDAVDSDTPLYVAADELSTERIVSNNSEMTLAQTLELEDFSMDSSEITYSGDTKTITVNLAAENNSSENRSCNFIIAVYTGGKMVNVSVVSGAETGTYSSFTKSVTLSYTGAAPFEVKLFALDSGTGGPLAGAYTQQLSLN